MKQSSITTRIAFLLAALLSIGILPWIGSYFYHDGVFPEGFFAYPQRVAPEKAPFNLLIFLAIAIAFAGVLLVYIFPKLAGFKKVVSTAPRPEPKPFPYWFWVGLLAWGSAIFVLWSHTNKPLAYVHWSDLPLFWGFTLMLDGVVYKRNGGVSLVSKIPQELIGIGVASISGWMIFEFLNFFIDDNWVYPVGNIIDREEFLLYACIISSGLLPLAFEWYCIFKTIPSLANRFSQGYAFTLSERTKTILLILAMAITFITGLFPDLLFFNLWVMPPIVLAIALDKIGVWTPLKPIGQGNWTPALLSALTYLVAGFCLEGQNYFSGIHNPDGSVTSYDPAYWTYSLPYVNVAHIFEMPALGFLGYMPFGIYCWLWWISVATLMNVKSVFLRENPLGPETENE